MKKVVANIILAIAFIFMFVGLPVLVGIVVEAVADIITIDFIMKVAYIMLACSFICILKKWGEESGRIITKSNCKSISIK